MSNEIDNIFDEEMSLVEPDGGQKIIDNVKQEFASLSEDQKYKEELESKLKNLNSKLKRHKNPKNHRIASSSTTYEKRRKLREEIALVKLDLEELSLSNEKS